VLESRGDAATFLRIPAMRVCSPQPQNALARLHAEALVMLPLSCHARLQLELVNRIVMAARKVVFERSVTLLLCGIGSGRC